MIKKEKIGSKDQQFQDTTKHYEILTKDRTSKVKIHRRKAGPMRGIKIIPLISTKAQIKHTGVHRPSGRKLQKIDKTRCSATECELKIANTMEHTNQVNTDRKR